MAHTALNILLTVTAVTAVQVGFAPAATSYMYRSDNDGPATFVQLGVPAPYHDPHNAFAVPSPLAEPVKAYYRAPLPLPYAVAKPIVILDAEEEHDDDLDESEEHPEGEDHLVGISHGGNGNGFAKGAGSDYGEQHHSAHGEKGAKAYKTQDHYAKGKSGHYGKEHHEGYYDEADGTNKGHHSVAGAHGKHYASGENYKGDDHGHKEHFSKGEDVTGFHKVFHKDEFKKDHDFYDVADNSGHFKKHGSQEGYHASEKGGHKEAGQHDEASNKGDFGKVGFHSEEHIDVGDDGHSAEEGHESYYQDEADHGKKGASSHEKGFGYGGDEDDDDYEDDDNE